MRYFFKGLIGLAVVWAVTHASGPLSAAEVFVCDGGESVAVEYGQLAHMKKTNACVASHFGLTVAKGGRSPHQAFATVIIPPLPERKVTAAAVALKSRKDPKTHGRKRKGIAVAAHVSAQQPVRQSDYRNVRIINAAPGSNDWYRHQR